MGIPIRVLIVEDSEDDGLLTLRQLRRGGYEPDWKMVETARALTDALDKGTWDIILSDYQMQAFDGHEALRIVKEKGLDIPFIVISGVLIEDNAVMILKEGASDYVRKGNWARLIPAVERELREADSRRQRKRAQQKQLDAQEQYRILFESAVEGIFQSTPSGKFISANPAMAQLLGYDSPKEMIEAVTHIKDQHYVRSDTRKNMLAILERSGTVSGFEAEIFRKDGSKRWVIINSRGIFDENGDLEIIEGFAVDITKRKQAEQELAEMNRQLERLVAERTMDLENKALQLEQANLRLKELDQLKTAFLSSVSHELRTPLTSVLGFAKLIHRDFCKVFLPAAKCQADMHKMGSRICNNLDIIVQEGERLTRLVNDFLDLTRIEAGRMNWDDQLIAPAPVLRHAAQAVTGLYAQNPDLRLLVEIADDLPEMTVDPDRLTQVIINLLNNAAKFTRSGRVILRAGSEADGQTLTIQVEDTGSGIPAQDIENIFTKFHQVKDKTAQDYGARGAGLGLAITKQIVERYGGSIRADSEVGRGSTFHIAFPIKPNADGVEKAL
ncbi:MULTISPECIES: ATP-binding protein [unclassified Pseudodesulfovibrio]|uniref:sensor histidine kinase n=1 Tax=unclassified Pseudodesulfovibrio TaxID=2661612 RepID=UPI0013E30194|nr:MULTISPECIES: ATP-binding protein [unclassified Pseudodesulfovibrio]MCJ2165521.1 ATP-binding protein [Pseudodesulfovibrio sp. S3-i]